MRGWAWYVIAVEVVIAVVTTLLMPFPGWAAVAWLGASAFYGVALKAFGPRSCLEIGIAAVLLAAVLSYGARTAHTMSQSQAMGASSSTPMPSPH